MKNSDRIAALERKQAVTMINIVTLPGRVVSVDDAGKVSACHAQAAGRPLNSLAAMYQAINWRSRKGCEDAGTCPDSGSCLASGAPATPEPPIRAERAKPAPFAEPTAKPPEIEAAAIAAPAAAPAAPRNAFQSFDQFAAMVAHR